MCGITGIWHLSGNPVEKEKIQRFNDSLEHRGPDGFGTSFHFNGALALGHRRLSILDLSDAGKQPMPYADGQLTISYNGEIFNFTELREELSKHGYSFKSDTDTEVILAAYHKWGTSCFHRFNGMWALAIWDTRSNELVLSRDRFGIKPLYYSRYDQNSFAFASETIAFRYLHGFKRQFDSDMIHLVQSDEYAIEGLGHTIFKNIHQILPGHFAVLKPDSGPLKQERWYSILDNKVDVPAEFSDQVEQFYSILEDSCKLRLQSDVPLATALSGGLDSSSVFSIVSKVLNEKTGDRINENSQKAYTASFPYLKSDELDYAKAAATFHGKKVIPIIQDIQNLGDKIYRETHKADYIGRPITSLSAVYEGMKSDGVSVSMDGHGVDEMLFGYRDMVYGLYNYQLFTPRLNPMAISEVLMNMYHENDRPKLSKRFQQDILLEKSALGKMKRWIKTNSGMESPPGVKEFMPIKLAELSNHPYDFANQDYPNRMLHHEFFQHSLPALLRNFDRAGMQNSVEIRMPFMDYRLVEYVFSLPLESKIGHGFTKLILREAMKGKMDEQIRTRTFKVGIASPMEYWFKNDLKAWMLDLLDDSLREDISRKLKSGTITHLDLGLAWKKINYRIIAEH